MARIACLPGDLAAVLARHLGRVVHVHCKDVRAAVLAEALAGDWSFMGAVLKGFSPCRGMGASRLRSCWRRCGGAGYGGWLVVGAEQDSRIAHPLTHARMGFGYLAAVAE